MLLPDAPGITDEHHMRQIQTGFESRIAQRGGATLAMPVGLALQARQRGELPELSGLFDFAFHPEDPVRWGESPDLPRVGFSGRIENGVVSDEVSYDDVDGGRQAAQHLIQMGHRGIAFLGLHPRDNGVGELIWSVERKAGWRAALQEADVESSGLSFLPATALGWHHSEHLRAARELGAGILRRPDITAVVAANDYAAIGLFEAARASRIPAERWPSVVGFDNLPNANGHVVTSLRLPGEQVGQAAADLLWERRHSVIGGPPQHRRVAMQLIARLTSRMDWSSTAGHVALAAPVSRGMPPGVLMSTQKEGL
jgi:DNA-binding LacI/PurR family transcriptional regulator